ncbi:hypothetical protein JCM19047_2971 [Bacillus sp. JCM 19047]|uniref:YesK family protein n=1 Tax=Shouchella miscanthi TaxID=2598861 RepID=UPI0003F040DC|nr:YesK family protein [Shouchella miscanthi]GAF23173.1 hypothetical protein JCM19047_2971 [Bacillus sp. JCM 19047]
MLITVPLGIGLAIGLIVFLITVLLGRGKQSKKIVYVPAIIAISSSLGLFAYGFVVVRGFEGAAYLFLSITIIISATFILFYSKRKLQ